MKNKKIYTVYKTTNLINNKTYIGVHYTDNIYDDYLGSGNALHSAIKKYGITNFKKEILFTFNILEDAYNKEAELVNEEFVKRDDTYNLRLGGVGNSWQHAVGKPGPRLGKKNSPETCAKLSKALKGRTAWNKGKTGIFSEAALEKLRSFRPNEEQLKKLKESHIGKQSRLGIKFTARGLENLSKSHMGIKPSIENVAKRKLTWAIKEINNNWLFYWFMIN